MAKKWFLTLALMILPLQVFADIDTPVILPANPTSNDVIEILVAGGDEHGLASSPHPSFEIVGNDISFIAHFSYCDFGQLACPPVPFSSTFSIGRLEPGDYTLHFIEARVQTNPPYSEELYTLQFSVAQGHSIPTMSHIGLLLMTLSVLALSLVALQKHR